MEKRIKMAQESNPNQYEKILIEAAMNLDLKKLQNTILERLADYSQEDPKQPGLLTSKAREDEACVWFFDDTRYRDGTRKFPSKSYSYISIDGVNIECSHDTSLLPGYFLIMANNNFNELHFRIGISRLLGLEGVYDELKRFTEKYNIRHPTNTSRD
jgi:hypothetical protein